MFQFQADLLNILVSLIDLAQTLVCLSPSDLDEAKSKCFQTVAIIKTVGVQNWPASALASFGHQI